MPDKLRNLVNDRDKANARPHRLEPERLVLPPRGEASDRRFCGVCWHVVTEADQKADYGRWSEAHPQKLFRTREPYPGIQICPNCGASPLHEVVH